MPEFSLSDPIFGPLAFYSGVLVLKTFAVACATGWARMRTAHFGNPEDVAFAPAGKGKHDSSIEAIARTKRAHLNDLENIPFFLILAPFYALANPSVSVALWHFRVFTGARIAATICHLAATPPPSRSIFFFVGFGTTVSMAVQILLYTL
eukprot:m.7084 g.7084  ORF g.7084 m.7084 type:complete len:150 (+) comp17660_c0_seq2:131-580(+)